MQYVEDPHDDPFEGAGPDPEFENERCWEEAGSMRRGQPAVFAKASEALPAEGPVATPRFAIDWIDRHREPRYPADPSYPNGTAIDVALDALKACRVELHYPAARCGMWLVRCLVCGFAIALETTGRRDDPRSVRVACKQT
jgi:hypothetical protein